MGLYDTLVAVCPLCKAVTSCQSKRVAMPSMTTFRVGDFGARVDGVMDDDASCDHCGCPLLFRFDRGVFMGFVGFAEPCARAAAAAEGDVMTLFRPVGVGELVLLAQSGFLRFPPRLPEQPFFYPVLSIEYARQIARDWNTKDAASGYAGFVTQFDVAPDVARRYEVHLVGGRGHQELWVPAAELERFNAGIVGGIRIVDAYAGQP